LEPNADAIPLGAHDVARTGVIGVEGSEERVEHSALLVETPESARRPVPVSADVFRWSSLIRRILFNPLSLQRNRNDRNEPNRNENGRQGGIQATVRFIAVGLGGRSLGRERPGPVRSIAESPRPRTVTMKREWTDPGSSLDPTGGRGCRGRLSDRSRWGQSSRSARRECGPGGRCQQHVQEVELPTRQVDGLTVPGHAATSEVDHDRTRAGSRGERRSARPPPE